MGNISQLRKLPVQNIPLDTPLEYTLCHQSSTPILAKGQSVSTNHVRALKAANISELYECRSEEDILSLVSSSEKQPLAVEHLTVGVPAPYNVYTNNNGFLLRKGGVLTQTQFQNMLNNGASEVWVDIDTSRQALTTYQIEYTKLSVSSLEQRMCAKNGLVVKAGASRLYQASRAESRSDAEIALFQTAKSKIIEKTDGFLKELQACKILDGHAINDVSQGLQKGLLADISLSLGTFFCGENEVQKYAQHSSKVATLSISIGLALGFNDADLKDLGLAALVHEIGMMALPHELIHKKEPLTPAELSFMRHHPVLAVDILRQNTDISERSILAVYQEHEAPNRSGYPNQRPGHLIHDFSKIIAVCDSYEAMTTARPYRPALLPYHAIEQMVKATALQRFDSRVMRALLQVVGLFPVGSWVKLSDHNFAKVVANNPECYDKPLVSVLFDQGGQPLSMPEFINFSDKEHVQIVDIADAQQFPGSELMGF